MRRLDELWKPEAGRFDFPGIANVFALRDRLRLYAPAMDAQRVRIEGERDSQLNALDTRLGDQLAGTGNLFASGAGSLQETLARIASIDPASPLLRTPDLEVGYARTIARALESGQRELARGQLALAMKQFPQSLRLRLQDAQLRATARTVADPGSVGSMAQATLSFEQLLRTPSAAADWQARMAAVMARLKDSPAQLQTAQLRLGEAIAATLASHDQPAQLPDDLILLDFGLEHAPTSAPLQQQNEHLQQRQQAVMASLEQERAQAEVVARGESLRRAVAAHDIDKAERLFARLRELQPDSEFVRGQAPSLLTQAYQSMADAQFAKGDYAAAVKGLARGIGTLGSNGILPKLHTRYQLVAAVMSVDDATSAAERERLTRRLETQFREDGTDMARLEREMQARGQLPQGSLRARLQLGGGEAVPGQGISKAGTPPQTGVGAAPP
ncbi:MAG: protein kinase, partial [Stenotrophomonas sp.]